MKETHLIEVVGKRVAQVSFHPAEGSVIISYKIVVGDDQQEGDFGTEPNNSMCIATLPAGLTKIYITTERRP